MLNIITPCSRPCNLQFIEKSMPPNDFRWIVVYDGEEIPQDSFGEAYCLKDENSRMGNAQRNLALSKVNKGWIYFNDDDTIIHKDFWNTISPFLDSTYDFISFSQEYTNGELRLLGNDIRLNKIDSHNFLFHYSLLEDSRWVLDRYDADGMFAQEIYKKAKHSLFINKVLSTYNALR